MALEVGIVGLPGAGKTTLFTALTRPAAPSSARRTSAWPRSPTTRLEQLAARGARKMTPATIRVVDVPGTGPALLGELRQVDAILAVADGFSARAIRRATSRRWSSSCSSPTATTWSGGWSGSRSRRSPATRTCARRSSSCRRSSRTSTRATRSATGAASCRAELEPLTTKPLLAVENGPGGIDLQLEAELAEMSDEEAAEFRDGPSALDEVVRRLRDALDLITFFTAGEKETRAWTLRRGADGARGGGLDPLRHRARLHPLRDDPRDDLLAAGSHAEAAKRARSGSRARRTRSRTATS